MEEEKYGFAHEREVEEVVRRFELMKRNNQNIFFDVSEFETIIDYYFENNNYAKAYDAAEIAVHQHPNSVPIQLRQARVLLDKGRAVETLRILRKLESIEPNNHEIYLIKGTALGMLGDIVGARKMFDTAIDYDREEPENTLYAITSILQNLNFYEEMISYMHRLIELEPFFHAHCYDLAYAYEKTGDLDNAIRYYKVYLEEEPLSDSAWYNLGIVYNRLEQYEKALEAYDYSIAINPVNTFALFNKGNILCNLERYAEALESYEEYLNLEEESPEVMTYIGECHEKLGRFDVARKYFQEAIESDPEMIDAWFGLGTVAFRTGMFNDAMMLFGKCIRLDDQNPEGYHMLSRSLYATGMTKECVRNLKKSLKIDPFFDEAWIDMANIIHETGTASKIVPILEKAYRITGDVPGLNYLLAACHLAAGKTADAYKDLLRATSVDREFARDFLFLYPDELLSDEIRSLMKTS
ncbi:MAG: tetratricopeptide repeat protein [Bacteroidales bacterium]|nr:tetratricopeptide repeat protein [Bacteroidales bacterium]